MTKYIIADIFGDFQVMNSVKGNAPGIRIMDRVAFSITLSKHPVHIEV